MAAWSAVVESEPDFAQRVRKIMDAHLHKTMATLRADGAPRISGIEASFVEGQRCFAPTSARSCSPGWAIRQIIW